jgi:hypothetical protein
MVVVLQEGDEHGRRQAAAGFAARRSAIRHHLALKSETLGERPAQQLAPADEVRVVAGSFASGRDMQHMVRVVVPLCCISARPPLRVARQSTGLVFLVLQD